MQTIGFIGLGVMGRPMAKNLADAGYTVIGNDINASFLDLAAQNGIKKATSIASLSAQCNIIITMLPSPAISHEVLLGKEGIAQHAQPGTLVIEMSSLTPHIAQSFCASLQEKHLRFIDAPVSGGEGKAIDGTLAIMAGGTEEDFAEAKPIFSAMAASITRVGDVGAGCLAKLANQIIVTVNTAAIAEALTLAAKAGADPALVFEAIRGGFAGSTAMNVVAPMMLDRNYEPGARVDILIKDLMNVLETSHTLHAPTPLSSQVMEMLQSLKAGGLGGIDFSGLVRHYEMLAHVEVKRGK